MRAEGIIIAVAETFGVHLVPITAKSAQTRLVGHQGATGREIKDAVEKRFGVRPATQHEADALAVGAALLAKLRISPPRTLAHASL